MENSQRDATYPQITSRTNVTEPLSGHSSPGTPTGSHGSSNASDLSPSSESDLPGLSHWVCAELHSWQNFLPKNAIVMGRKKPLETVPKPPPLEEAPAALRTGQANDGVSEEPARGEDTVHRLHQVAAELTNCTRCKLCENRKTVVFGEGNPKARLMFIGEGPGEQEDLVGRPFVGKAGQLLDKMIEAIGLKRSEIYIANVVKCRPPGNRNPESDEIQTCSPFLLRQIDIIQPQVIVALGKFAAQTLLNTEEKITRLRGTFRTFRGVQLMPTFHPAYLLRNPGSKKEAWVDLQLVAKELGLNIPKRR